MTLTLDKDNPLATKVQTRDGRKARLICVDKKSQYWPVMALVTADCKEYTVEFTAAGMANQNGEPSTADLINVPVEHRRWVNFIRWADGVVSAYSYETRRQADLAATPARIACVEVVFKEGDGL